MGGEDYPRAVIQPPANAVNPVERFYSYREIDGVLFLNGRPRSSDIDQGIIRTGYLMSALGAIADTNPQAIRDMIIDNGDGTFCVRFLLENQTVWVTVDRKVPVAGNGFLVFAGNDRQASLNALSASVTVIWPILVERAYAQLNETGLIRQSGRNEYNQFRNLEGGIEGGNAIAAMSLIAKGRFSMFYVAPNTQLSNLIMRAIDFVGIELPVKSIKDLKTFTAGAYKGITVGTLNKPASQMRPLLAPRQEYMVLAASQTSIVLINPWGESVAPITLDWNAFANNFCYCTRYEKL